MRRADAACGLGLFLALLTLGADDYPFDRASWVEVVINPRVEFSGLETYQWHADQRIVAELGHHLRMVVAV